MHQTTAPSLARLDHRQERLRRLRTLLITVPGLLNRHLRPLGWRRFTWIAGLLARAPRYARQFARPDDDAGHREVKKTFLLVGALYQELRARHGAPMALQITDAFLFDLGCAVQRQAYAGGSAPLTWGRFHDEHEAQMREGFIRHNEVVGLMRSEQRVALEIKRCRFFEAFRDMGEARLAEAFCRSDEAVFNGLVARMRFHRGGASPDTIARGATRCRFVFERMAASTEARPPHRAPGGPRTAAQPRAGHD